MGLLNGLHCSGRHQDAGIGPTITVPYALRNAYMCAVYSNQNDNFYCSISAVDHFYSCFIIGRNVYDMMSPKKSEESLCAKNLTTKRFDLGL